MATQVKMPQLGETVVEGTITRWLKREGESVGMDEPLVEVSTDKVDSEIPSPVSGTVSRIHAGEGETVTVGSVIAEIAGAGLVVEMRHALERNEFELFYQPKLHLRSGLVTRVEVLLRWNHPKRGTLAPALFIPIAER